MLTCPQKAVQFEVEGQTIAATLHIPVGDGNRPAVLFCHGFTGNRIESHFIFVKMSRELQRRGIASLRIDFRGSGESEGDFSDMSVLTEIADAKEALGFLAETGGVDLERLGILGLSMGGCVAACVSPDERVKSLVLWSAVSNLQEVLDKKITPEGGAHLKETGTVDVGGHLVGTGFFEAVSRVDPLDAIGKSKAHVLVIHGENDESVPVGHAGDYYDAVRGSGARTELRIIPGAGHTFADAEHERQVMGATAQWFEDTL